MRAGLLSERPPTSCFLFTQVNSSPWGFSRGWSPFASRRPVRHVPSYQVYQGGPRQAEQETLTCKDQGRHLLSRRLKTHSGAIREPRGYRAVQVESGTIGGTGRVRGPRDE